MEESLNIYSASIEKLAMEKQDIRTISPLTLAYIGDRLCNTPPELVVIGIHSPP